MDNEKLLSIKKTILYFYSAFLEETRDSKIALELTKEAMTTWRTYILAEKEDKEDRVTYNQLMFLKNAMGNFRTSDLVMEELRKLNKKSIEELSKSEASQIISKIKGRE